MVFAVRTVGTVGLGRCEVYCWNARVVAVKHRCVNSSRKFPVVPVENSPTRKLASADQREALRAPVHQPPFPHSGTVLSERPGAVKAALLLRDEVEP
jgi:hypothetical protein